MKPVIDYLAGIATSKLEHVERSRCRAGAEVPSAHEIAQGLTAPALPDSLRAELLEIPRRTISYEGADRLLPVAVENELGDGTVAVSRAISPPARVHGGLGDSAAAPDLAQTVAESPTEKTSS